MLLRLCGHPVQGLSCGKQQWKNAESGEEGASWHDLPKKNDLGEDYFYTVEAGVDEGGKFVAGAPTNYRLDYSENHLNIKYTYLGVPAKPKVDPIIAKIIQPVVPAITYDFTLNDVSFQQQIVKNGESLVEPASPPAATGKKFVGWYEVGASNPISFGTSITVEETKTVTVEARFTEVFYVYFKVEGNIVTTKEVAPNGTVNANGVPLVINTVGKAFDFWSADGTNPFDFATPITANITLTAVLTDRYKVTFVAQGGSAVVPAYVIAGGRLNHAHLNPSWLHPLVGQLLPAAQSTLPAQCLSSGPHAVRHLDSQDEHTYTVIYWHQNTDDNNYVIAEVDSTRTGTTGTPATYTAKTYTGFNFKNAPAVTINGDGSSVRNGITTARCIH